MLGLLPVPETYIRLKILYFGLTFEVVIDHVHFYQVEINVIYNFKVVRFYCSFRPEQHIMNYAWSVVWKVTSIVLSYT
jgi:hypothetical protein